MNNGIVLFLNEYTPLISRALTAQLMFSDMQTTKQTDFLMMWLNAILILVLTPFNEFYDGPINRHALTTCRHIMKIMLTCPYNVDPLTLHFYMSLVVRKPDFCIYEIKDADQLRGNRKADQRLCFRHTDSIIPLIPKSDISSL